MNTRQATKGFTLIELMILVAIVGILAAFAMAQYQMYVGKTQVSRVMNELSALRPIAEICLIEGRTSTAVPDAPPTSETMCDMHRAGSNLIANHAAGGMGIPTVALDAASPTIAGTLGGAASPFVAGATITWTRNPAGVWTCKVTGAPSTFNLAYTQASCPIGGGADT